MLGKLSWQAIPWDQPIPLAAGGIVLLILLGVFAWIAVKGHVPYLWREWITSVDHKRIGVMYVLLGMVMLVRGFIDALMMRSQQALAFDAPGYLPPEHFDQIFSAHGTIMIFFGAMPLMIGLMNFAVPLQLGVRDVAFPTLNSTSFWLTATGALLVNVSLVVGEFARTGWLPYPPLSELSYSPGVGVDYYLWSLLISGVGTLLTGVNFVTTILKIRAPGMSYMRMPMFTWTALASNLLIVAAFPALTATLLMLTLDRYLGFHFFTNAAGGNMMMFINLIWVWGHPEVYILVLPAFGIFSEIFSTFSGKPLFGYRSMVMATLAICLISFMVWLHHFFTMGAGADVNGVFGIATSIIAVATGVKIYNWLFTMYGGSIRFATPMLWALGFLVTFTLGGMTGVLLAVPPADFLVHNSLFLVAHFHNVIIGGVVFGAFAGVSYWFPKAFGFRLHEGWGKAVFWLALVGFYVVFVPLYAAGLLGMTRRLQHYDVAMWRPYVLVAAAGIVIMAVSAVCQVMQLVVSIRERRALRDELGIHGMAGRSNGRPASPPPAFNFAVLPQVHGDEPYWEIKRRAIESQQLAAEPQYEAIEMPRNSPTGVITAFFATHHRLRAYLAHLVAGGRGTRRGLCGVRVVRMARRRGARHPGDGGGASSIACGARRARPGLRGMRRSRSGFNDHRRHLCPDRASRSRSRPVQARPSRRRRPRRRLRGDRARRRRSGIEAGDRRLRILDLPAERHRDVLVLLRGARGVADGDCRRAVGTRIVRSDARCHRDGLPPGLELHLRPVGGRNPCAQPALDRRSRCWSPACSASPSSISRSSNSPAWWPAAPDRSAARSCRRSSQWSAFTACTSARGCCGWGR